MGDKVWYNLEFDKYRYDSPNLTAWANEFNETPTTYERIVYKERRGLETRNHAVLDWSTQQRTRSNDKLEPKDPALSDLKTEMDFACMGSWIDDQYSPQGTHS